MDGFSNLNNIQKKEENLEDSKLIEQSSESSVGKVGIINNKTTDPNKILPMTYLWAREHYKSGVANNWVPEEVSMQKDIEQWKSDEVLNDTEKRLILWNLGFFSTAESLTANNLVLAIYRHVTNPEARCPWM